MIGRADRTAARDQRRRDEADSEVGRRKGAAGAADRPGVRAGPARGPTSSRSSARRRSSCTSAVGLVQRAGAVRRERQARGASTGPSATTWRACSTRCAPCRPTTGATATTRSATTTTAAPSTGRCTPRASSGSTAPATTACTARTARAVQRPVRQLRGAQDAGARALPRRLEAPARHGAPLAHRSRTCSRGRTGGPRVLRPAVRPALRDRVLHGLLQQPVRPRGAEARSPTSARKAAFKGATVVLSNHDLPVVRNELYPSRDGFRHVARPRVARAISRAPAGASPR